MLTTTTIYTMDLETYKTLMITRQQFLDAGATDAIVDDLTEEKMDQLRREMWPERYMDDDEETLTANQISDEFDDTWTIWDEIDMSPTDWYMGNF